MSDVEMMYLFQDYVAERIKKIGGMTSFNIYIMREFEMMYSIINEVKQTLTVSRPILIPIYLGIYSTRQ
jgi:hypothetical protein